MISVTNTSLSQEIIARYTNFFSVVPSQAQMVLLEQMPTMPQEQAAPRRIVQEIYQIENCLEQNTLLHLHFHLQFLDRLVQGATQKLLDTVQRDVQMRQHSLALTRQENQTKVDVSQTRRLLEQALRNTSPVFQRDQQQSARYADQLRQTLAPVLLPAVGPVEVIYPAPDQPSQLPVVRAIESGSSLLLEGYPQVSTVQTRGDIPLTLTHREESVPGEEVSQQQVGPSQRMQTSQQPPVSRESGDHEPQRGQSPWEGSREDSRESSQESSREALRPFPRAEEPQSRETIQTRGDTPLTLTHREESVPGEEVSQQQVGPSQRMQPSQQPPVSRESRDHESKRGQSTREALREVPREALRPFPRAEEPQSRETIQTRGNTPLTLTHREESVSEGSASQQTPSQRMQTSQQPPVSRESRDHEPQRGQSPWEGSRESSRESSQESSREALRPFPRAEEPQSRETIQTRGDTPLTLTHREESVSEGSASQQTPSQRMQTSQQPPVSRESRDHEPQRGQSTWEALREASREALRPFPRAEEPQPRETIQTRGDIPLTLTHREESVSEGSASQQTPSQRMQTSQQPPVSRESGDHEPQRGQSTREALRGTSREALRPFPRAEEPQPRETIQTRGDIPLTLTHREESVSEGSASQQTPSQRMQISQQLPVSRESRDHEPKRGQSTREALREVPRAALRPFPRAEEPQPRETIQTRGDIPLTLTHREESVPGEEVSQQQVGPSQRMQPSQQPPVSRESGADEPQRGQSTREALRGTSQESSREALRPFPRAEEPQSKETIQTRGDIPLTLTHREESVSEGSASQQIQSQRMQTSQQPPVSRESGDHEPQRGQSTREALRGTSRAALRPFPRAEEPQPRETIQTRGDIPLTLTHREAEQGEPGSLMSRFSLSERGVLGQQRAFSPLGTVSAAEQRRALQERSIAGSQANWNGTPASLVHRSEEKVAIPSPQAEEDFVGIPTVRTTRTGQRSQQVQQVVTQDIQPAGDRLTLTGENSPLLQAQIEKMADRVYKVIENRLRQEKFRRGMW